MGEVDLKEQLGRATEDQLASPLRLDEDAFPVKQGAEEVKGNRKIKITGAQ